MISPYCYPGTFRNLPTVVTKSRPVMPERIAKLMANYYGVPVDALFRKCRKRKIIRARHMAWHFMKIFCPLISLKDCGRVFGDYDHTTVLHARQTIMNLIETDDATRFEATHLNAIITAEANQ